MFNVLCFITNIRVPFELGVARDPLCSTDNLRKYVNKNASAPKLALKTRTRTAGVKILRSHKYKGISKSQRSITRAYAGVYSPKELKERITRAFLLEEVKLAKAKIQLQDLKAKAAKKDDKKKKSKKAK